ncbi:hypothetical protein A3A93_05440 [Candidatus Roizmanbacteria bacterium RIFCSPLOWO2_01_FULL_38_12]|uniref:Pyridoxamine 5'-phosphate oxidase N-terminal domain-containing protein n=1 Tax=Candidatus Roizmanbacteria bacterium RIFCSPLOWO2_01_FULL_38_12 TaxID=1802061 RepID=A0A1F7IZ45_9BACT|nr:MAG: hypothetical protein A2861_03655 [Candidatus Roizmanbacteria bacterium RIFCSPHIGHO2_01_FULL_38_15]OGK35664.1 MAG: hypothetical protein A3F59_01870 [Candidatus Roizmanbacteria bacterium RIFCSPHIGHO2_12_FULL_38_13]OGK48630.1 MAG: hypothetical protein A3A93_05440 [Candidatus Roizmanbacteria bacterium RIFCSPLOWO2_01_FULL_38_12]
MNLTKIANNILKSNIYMTLATSSKSGHPWASPVYYAMDDKHNFYFISKPNTLHSRHIHVNPHIALAIFDSHQPEGKGNGIQEDKRIEVKI